MLTYTQYVTSRIDKVNFSYYECIGILVSTLREEIDYTEDALKKEQLSTILQWIVSGDTIKYALSYKDNKTTFVINQGEDTFVAIFYVKDIGNDQKIYLRIEKKYERGPNSLVLLHEFTDDEEMELINFCTWQEDRKL